MTATTTTNAPVTPEPSGTPAEVEVDPLDEWRGVGTVESTEDISRKGSVFLKHRSRALLADLLRPYKKAVALLILVVVIENAARLAIPSLVRRGIDLGVPPLLAGGSGTFLYETVALMLAAVVVQAISRVTFLRSSGRIGQQVLLEIRRRTFRHFQKLDVAFHDKYTSGRVVSRMTNDVDAIQELLIGGFDGLIKAVLTMLGVGILLLTLDVKLGAICLLSFPLLMLLVRWFSKASSRTYRRVRENSALVIVQFVETMTGIRAVEAYRRQRRNQEIFEGLADRYSDANVDSFRLVAVFMPVIKLIGNVTIGVVLLYGGLLVVEGDMTVGVLAAFLLYLRMFFEPMQDISQFYNTFQSASAALEKLSGVLEEQPTVVEPRTPTPLPQARGAVHFDHVTFSYTRPSSTESDAADPRHQRQRTVLPGLELSIPEGQTVALVGTTGAGKTTIAKMMARFYDPDVGRVTLDGTDLRDLSDTDLRRAVVMVTQENFMFDGSVADNISFGRPSAGRDEIIRAATAVGAHEFICALPHGYDTDVAKRGARLSAGQRQLVAFARAFLADPAVLILDEATSSLDVPSERLVQRALGTILARRTAVIIAHRLSTVEVADRVLVLEHGEIVEDGSPAELMNRPGGRYAALHHAWEESLA